MTRPTLSLAVLGLTACFSLAPVVASAQTDQPAAPQAANNTAHESKMQRHADHIEGHIAYLKTELMITPAQEAAWDKVADEMRAGVKTYEDAVAKLPAVDDDKPQTALQSLAERQQFATLKSQGESNFIAAFTPLYNSFSDQQKTAADDVFASGSNNK